MNKKKNFHAPLKKQKLKNSKEITAKRNVFGQLVLLALENDISLESVPCFPLGAMSWAFATADGIPAYRVRGSIGHSGIAQGTGASFKL